MGEYRRDLKEEGNAFGLELSGSLFCEQEHTNVSRLAWNAEGEAH